MNAPGRLIVNADDWGRDRVTTDRTMDCALSGSVSSVSAMVFMEDSKRAAEIARERRLDAGLHLNFTTPFSGPTCTAETRRHLEKASSWLRRYRLAQAIFHPMLTKSFQYLIAAQWDEFHRLYGYEPVRIDGHHHMHLCANVLLGRLLPEGTIVRRSFSFSPGERSNANLQYRRAVDWLLVRRHRTTDYFFSLFDPGSDRLDRIVELSRLFVVEVETHPAIPGEYRFLIEGEIFRLGAGVKVASGYCVSDRSNGDRPATPRFSNRINTGRRSWTL